MRDEDRIISVVNRLAGFFITKLFGTQEKKLTEFKGVLGSYKIIKTEDNTETIWSEYFNEACHNLSGAYEETLHNYISGCAIPDLITHAKNFAVLDVGFGVGVGLRALIDQLKSINVKESSAFYYSIELDETLLQWSLKQTLPELKLERKLIETDHGNLVFYQGIYPNESNDESNSVLHIQIYVGDGRVTLPMAQDLGLIRPVNAIFQDAFSPRKNPALWSTEWFQFLKGISTQKVRLSTYSSSITIRKSLIAAGWAIENAQGFALKRSMTKANLTGVTSSELLLQLSRSPSLEIKDK
ncbi:MAG: hypothetical protein EHM20_05475 [Alphaproteobacteria bacterium]|nr:MAG: hypothetical protein EHM20_05475 [Alphaproteobacteria bacterium]